MAPGEFIDESWLPRTDEAAGAWRAAPAALPSAAAPAPAAPPGVMAAVPAALVAPAEMGECVSLPIGTSLAQAERLLMLATLRHYNHQRERTAAALGISLKTLYNRLKEYAAEDDQNKPTPPSS
jgi:DNA-binding NtrC family response regulator